MLKCWTDGACKGNPGPGGWAFMFEGEEPVFGSIAHTTNNTMEVYAIQRALEHAPVGETVIVHSDSRVAIGWMTGKYRVNCAHIRPVVDIAHTIIEAMGLRVSYKHVPGHSYETNNNIVDRAASLAARVGSAKRSPCQP